MKQLLEKLPGYNKAVLPYHFAQGVIASAKYHHPAKGLHVIGVTGTNGKTTTCFMIWRLLRSAGYKVGLMTTVAWGVDELNPELGHMTTVDAFTLNQRISEIKKQGAEYLVLEVTSHALAEYRTFGIAFELAVFTNLTHEHLDYHKTLANYRATKGKLFKAAKFSILNADDPSCKYYQTLTPSCTTYGIQHGEHRATDIKLSATGTKYTLDKTLEITTHIPGEFNVYNSMAAALVGRHFGLTDQQIEQGIASLESVEGRMNIINEGQPFTVIVDYAHAPDALEKVFASLPQNHKGKIISVHGGAGRRDPSTRAIRGRILAKYSDIVIITEDDSRDEDPTQIAAEFIRGATKQGKILNKNLFEELDRRAAIELALEKARPGDIVLILGKGHEKTILRRSGAVPFEDAKVARELLRKIHH